jgi:hypothetical protein
MGRRSGISPGLTANNPTAGPHSVLKLTGLSLFTKRLIKRRAICPLRGGADPIVEKLGSLTDEDAPPLRLHTIKDDGCCFGSAYGCVIAETLGKFRQPCPDLIVGKASDVHAPRDEPFARGRYVDRRLREFVMMSVPMRPGMTTEHLMCGALSERSVIRASVKPLTANFAAEYAVLLEAQKPFTLLVLTMWPSSAALSSERNALVQ